MSSNSNSTPTIEELQQEAVKILQGFNDPQEEFDTSKVKDTLLNIYHDMYMQKNNTVFGDDDSFCLYKIHRIVQQVEAWQVKGAIWSVSSEQ